MKARMVPCALLLMLGGCTGVQAPLAAAGVQASALRALLVLMSAVCGTVYLLVIVFLAAGIWRARRARARGRGAIAPVVEPVDPGLGRALLLWTGIVIAGLTLLISASFLVDRGFAKAPTADALEVRVSGHQWWWRIAYRDPASGRWIETANELHLPAGRTTRVLLGSADVIHSFWVPDIAGKMDVIPGRTNAIDLTPTRIGWYRGQCAEFCGAQHARMAFDVKVDDPATFAAWLRGPAATAAVPRDAVLARGMRVVTGGACAMCHAVRGTSAVGRAGPDLTHVGSRRSIAAGAMPMSRGALQGWIVQPQALKPGAMMPAVALDPAAADAAARYLESLR